MSNGVTLIIAPEDFNKVSNNWEQVDTIVIADPYNGYAYVDLGLPSGTKWATMNVGASNIEDYGNYYQYGKGSAQYVEISGDSNYSGTEDPLAASADTAAQVMGGQWHMPTYAQFNELIANTTLKWSTINGVRGGKYTATNGNYVFFPAGGLYISGSITNVGSDFTFLTSTPTTNESNKAWFFFSGQLNSYSRNGGYSVRGVVG